MASGTFSAKNQAGLLPRVTPRETLAITLTPTASSPWLVALEVTTNGFSWDAVAVYSTAQTQVRWRNDTNNTYQVRLRVERITAPDTIAYTMVELPTEEIIKQVFSGNGEKVFELTGAGVTAGVTINEYFAVKNIDGANGENLLWNPDDNRIASDLEGTVISGGGNAANPQLIGYTELRDRLQGDGTNTTFTTTFDVSSPSSVRVRLIRTDKVRVTVTSFCAITIVGGKAQVVYPTPGNFVNNATGGSQGTDPALLATEQLEIVSIQAAENIGSGCNYSGIYGGYNNVIQQGVMSHIIGAHHRIVAGDHNTIIGGSYARVDAGSYGFIAGGTANEITATGTGGVILGGNANTTNGSGPSYILGGSANTVSAVQAACVGGANNVVSGNGALVGGRENTISGRDALAGGFDNTASGVYPMVAGFTNVVTGAYGAAWGRENTATAESSVAIGRDANARLIGAITQGAQKFATLGDCQSSVLTVRRQTTNASPIPLLAQSGVLAIPADTTWTFRCLVSARRVDGGGAESAAYQVLGAIKNDAGTTALLGSATVTVIGEDDATWDVTVVANNSTDSLEIRVTGAANKTINWVGRLELAEVTG